MGSIDGLISGLNTTTIIAQLMTIERLPEAQLTKQQTDSQTMVSTLQSLNTLITSMQTAANAFVPDSITKQSAWTSTTATSSNSALAAVVTGAGALPGSATFTVTSVASAGSAVSLGTVGSLTTPVASGPFQLTKGGVSSTITVAAGATLTDVVSALNAPGTGVSATAVQVANGAYRLQLTSTTTGSASDVTLSSGAFPPGQSTLGDMQQLSAGTDTVLHVGTGPGAFDVTSSTTSVSGMIPGVTISALMADPNTAVTINVAADSSGVADKMASMVAQANAVLSYIQNQSSYDATSKTGGPLVGDSMGRDLTQRLTDAVIGSSSSTPAMAGVSVARDGSITFDRTAFLAAYAADPGVLTSTMTSMSQQLSDVATQASDPHTGFVTTRVTNEQDNIRGTTAQIAAFEERMTLRQQTLTTQYAALETMLGTLKSQSDWLTGQLATLPTTSSK
jgi:flagellar hook-associated protein 2